MNTVRIISGKCGGRKIMTPGDGTHPMGERERLALFNMISGYLEGARVLDAYAGSGALGIEALSRGAKEVVFLEKSRKAAEVIQANLKELGIEGEAVVGNALAFEAGGDFDVIMADPPYDQFDLTGVERLAKSLKRSGVLILSHPNEAPELPGLELLKTRKYAGAHLSVYAMR